MYAQERIPVEEVFEQLKCTKEGLSNEEGDQRLQIFGPNKLEEKKAIFSIFQYFYSASSLSVVMNN
ncbi:hypothetical protein ACSBR2_023567 [Camellia fascicularis]